MTTHNLHPDLTEDGYTQSLARDNLTDEEKRRGLTNGRVVNSHLYIYWVQVWPKWRDNEAHDRFWFRSKAGVARFELNFRALGWRSAHGQEAHSGNA